MSVLYDYNEWINFTKSELVCSETGKENPNIKDFKQLMDKIQELRAWYGKPMTVTSGYRSEEHSIEAAKVLKKGKGGMHTVAAIDIRVPPEDVHKVLKKAFEMGFTGIGVNCKGKHKNRFIHLDLRLIPWVWSY